SHSPHTTRISPLSLHDALPISTQSPTIVSSVTPSAQAPGQTASSDSAKLEITVQPSVIWVTVFDSKGNLLRTESGFFISAEGRLDRKSTRLNSSHLGISYAVFC